MQKKHVLTLTSLAFISFLGITSILLSNKQFLSKKFTYNSKASETSSSAVQLTVHDNVISTTSNNILGYSNLTGIGGGWTLEEEKTKRFYQSMNNGLNRIVMEGVFRRVPGKTEWNAWYDSKTLDIRDGRLHMQKSATETKGNWIYTQLSPANLIKGQQYTFSFDYDGVNLQPAPNQDYDHYRLGAVNLGYVDSFDNGEALTYFKIPTGTNKSTATVTFTYNPQTDKDQAWIRVFFWLHSPGELYIDNVKLSPANNPSVNFVRDPGFDTSQSGSIITPKDVDDNIAFTKAIGQEPILALAGPNWYIPEQTGLSEADFTRYILNHPNLPGYIDTMLDEIKYINTEKQYGLKYYEFGNEPELWWHNTLGEVRERYYLYGKLYAMLAKKAKTINPHIEFGLALYGLGEGYKDSIDGLFAGIKDYEQQHTGDSATTPVPLPDFFTTHAVYQLRAWGGTPKCSTSDMRACIQNLFVYAAPSGKAYCNDGSVDIGNMNDNVETLSFVEPYLKCTGNYLKTKGIAHPKFIPTEWGPSGSNQDIYYYYASAVWSADRIGRMARSGIAGQNFLVGYLPGYPTYPVFALYGRFLKSGTSLLQTDTSADDKVSMYTFKNPDDSKLYAVITNRTIEDGISPVNVTLPANMNSLRIKQIKINCEGTDCLYQKDVFINGVKSRFLLDTNNAVDIVRNAVPTQLNFSSNSFSIPMENHSILFWEIENNELPVGNFDIGNCEVLAGWAYDKNVPVQSIKVRFYNGPRESNHLILEHITDFDRPDVNAAVSATGIHGFNIPVPAEIRSSSAEVRVYAYAVDSDNGKENELWNGPKSIYCGSTPLPTSSSPSPTTAVTPSPTATPFPTHTPTPSPTTPATGTHITIRAYGTICQGEYPTMVLKIGNNEVRRWNSVGATISNYTFDSTQSYAGTITVHFINDCYKPPEDRNLFVDYITINGTTIQSEAQGVYNTGGYGEWLWSNGFIQYPAPTSSSNQPPTLTPTRIPPTPTLSSDTRSDSSECERRYGSGASCETTVDCIRSDGQVKDMLCDTGKFCCVSRR